MPKEFTTWISDMAGSIKDNSTFHRDVSKAANEMKTDLQIRMAFADMLVPSQHNDNLVSDWLAAFCAGLDSNDSGKKNCTEVLHTTIIGNTKQREYLMTEDDVKWLKDLKKDIENGVTSWD